MSKQVTKTVNGITYALMDEVLFKRGGVLYKNSYWLEGAGTDTNADGQISNIPLECKVPDGQTDIDLSTLKEECLFREGDTLIYKE